MPGSAVQIRALAAADTGVAAAILAEAFAADPFACHLLPDPQQRQEGLRRAFLVYLQRVLLRQHQCYIASDGSGVACWMPPGTWPIHPAEEILLIPGLAKAFGVRKLPKTLLTIAHVQKAHPCKHQHWYLLFLGVLPRNQGSGIGSLLLEPVLSRCDRTGLPAYLETALESNIRFYMRHGFSVLQEIIIPNGPLLWGMWRDPLPRS